MPRICRALVFGRSAHVVRGVNVVNPWGCMPCMARRPILGYYVMRRGHVTESGIRDITGMASYMRRTWNIERLTFKICPTMRDLKKTPSLTSTFIQPLQDDQALAFLVTTQYRYHHLSQNQTQIILLVLLPFLSVPPAGGLEVTCHFSGLGTIPSLILMTERRWPWLQTKGVTRQKYL